MLDYPLIRLHEKLLQWIWDSAGISRLWAIRGAGALACAADVVDQLRLNGHVGLMSVAMAVAVLSAQGASEARAQRHGKNANLFIEVNRALPIKTVLRLSVVLIAVIAGSQNMTEPLLHGTGVRWPLLVSAFAIVSFFYFIDSREPTDPPMHQRKQPRLAPTLL
jgi:hypothetical protein